MALSTDSERPGAELVTWLAALRTLSAQANADSDLREVLCLVADTARTLLGFDFCGVLIPDASHDRLVVQGWSGLSEEYVQRVNSDRPIRLGSGSPSSQAFHRGEPVSIRDVRDEPEFALWAGVAQEQGYRAIVAVPLVAGTDVLGTLNGYYASVHTFTRYEIERLILLANHAAIAVTSARRLDELRTLTSSLREQRDALARSEQIHERLLTVTLRFGGISGIAAALSDLISRPILIDDGRQTELARAGEGVEFPTAAVRASVAEMMSPEAAATVERSPMTTAAPVGGWWPPCGWVVRWPRGSGSRATLKCLTHFRFGPSNTRPSWCRSSCCASRRRRGGTAASRGVADRCLVQ
ncbi:GAF domain-containing protein [Mycolicibacterium conceptionense]|uniref:GAF domain-containing protein n=1 Tax=Mycolicibacterium conceptionense TaxID=451644 RepID=A0A0U1DT71_9MYCO|nr:GAF domain-containing protein [Mycolicibacterium conceptionense]